MGCQVLSYISDSEIIQQLFHKIVTGKKRKRQEKNGGGAVISPVLSTVPHQDSLSGVSLYNTHSTEVLFANHNGT